MHQSLSHTIKKTVTFFLIVLVTSTSLFAQEKANIPDVEKIYLHTDRSTYVLGESIWYKAYLVYAYNNLLFNHSNILYVELISPDSKIVARNKTRLQEGLGHGDFKLTDSVGVNKPGKYQIRAYTNWTRSFGDDFVFKKEIEIIDVFETESLANKNKKSSELEIKSDDKNSTQTTKKNIDIQFFPEGGSLIENIPSIVAFKAVDKNGKPIKVQGKVLDGNGELVTRFISVHDGMGKFELKPLKNEKYHVDVSTLNGDKIEVNLPKIKEHGYLLGVKILNNKEIVTIKTNNETLSKYSNESLTIKCTTRSITYFEGSQPLTGTSLSFELPKADFPEGISQITLYDSNLKPQSERLVFIEKNNDLKVTVTTDKITYKPKEKVIVNVSSKTESGDFVPASFSLSITDMNGTKEGSDYGTNISSYFLMESDIRGKLHNPSYYFDTGNPKRLYHLDLLLLTQGWRDFLWKTLPKAKEGLTYNIEKGITVAGSLKQLFGNKPKEKSQVTLALLNKGKANMLFSVTDSIGRFKFEDMVFIGNATMMLNTQNEKGKNRGMFVLDSLHQPAMAVNFKNEGIDYTSEINTIKEEIYKKHITFGVAPENVLGEVELFGKKKDNYPSLYGPADHTYLPDEKTPSFSTIQKLIQFTIPGIVVNGSSVGFNRYNGPAYIIIDGSPSLQDDLDFIHPDDVAKIESMNGAGTAIFGSKGGNGVIIIYTKEGSVNRTTKPVFHSITKNLEGFYDARVFYVPNLDAPSLISENSDAIRNTLYWNPYVHPDKTGVSQMEYYNSAVETNVKLTLEGMTATGIPVVVKTTYIIKK